MKKERQYRSRQGRTDKRYEEGARFLVYAMQLMGAILLVYAISESFK